jgi:hypothetical protein
MSRRDSDFGNLVYDLAMYCFSTSSSIGPTYRIMPCECAKYTPSTVEVRFCCGCACMVVIFTAVFSWQSDDGSSLHSFPLDECSQLEEALTSGCFQLELPDKNL